MDEPRDVRDLCEIITVAAQNGDKLEIRGGGSKAEFGGSREANLVSMQAIAGVVDYDPAELILTVLPGTPLVEIQALVAAEGQMLAFEPFDYAPVYAGPVGATTIGGVIAAGVAGSRRVTAGSARDHLLGFSAISGRGESFVGGAKVVKNVTGYDLPKLMAGSWGRIGVMTEMTIKVLPRPRKVVTMAVDGLAPHIAHAVMASALGSNADISAAGHHSKGTTILRVAGFEGSVAVRIEALKDVLRGTCNLRKLAEKEADSLWSEVSTGAGLSGRLLWRAHIPARYAPDLIERLKPLGIEWAMDWGGGLVWIALDDPGCKVRETAALLGGEAVLVRAPEAVRSLVPAFHPGRSGVAALERRVRRAFDPVGVFESGRFPGDGDAD